MKSNREPFAVSKFSREQRLINLSPAYQREGGVWSLPKQQLFIDSLLNGYDIPKIYMHKLDRDATAFDYAVVDGKQRIGTIFDFLAGKFPLASDFTYSGPAELKDPPKAGDFYSALAEDTKAYVKECSLDVVVVDTKDLEDIEELFSRLNNGEKLNAAESRNAIGGKMAELVRELAADEFFTKKFGFANTRYAYYEVACKLLYLENESAKAKGLVVVDLKKKFLDDFVRQFKNIADEEAKALIGRVRENLKQMVPVFEDKDVELGKQSYPQLMYLFLKHTLVDYAAHDLKARIKTFLRDFRIERELNLQKDEDSRDPELAEYGRLTQQGTNDAGSMQNRIDMLTKRFLKANPEVELRDPKRAFTPEERWVIWQLADKKCSKCGIALPTLEDMDADHIVMHVEGGPTSLKNARALCVSCNRGRKPEHSQPSLV